MKLFPAMLCGAIMSIAAFSTTIASAEDRPIIQVVSGQASWYGPGFNGKVTASGEVFNKMAMTAAHRQLPFGTVVRVTNLNNGRSVLVKINDRGPFHGKRIIDLSEGAATEIGLRDAGVGNVKIEILG